MSGMEKDIVDVITEEHLRFRRLFSEVRQAPPTERRELFRHLVAELAGHEAAEEAIVHRALRDDVPGGKSTAESILQEENQAEKMLADMKNMDPVTPDFITRLDSLQNLVLSHADHEEEEELPMLREHIGLARLREMGQAFEKTKSSGPTHPHPKIPQTP